VLDPGVIAGLPVLEAAVAEEADHLIAVA
jgi:hypothetical protein